MSYFRERARPALIGLLLGLLIGWFQPTMLGVAAPGTEARLFLSMQMGLAFMMLGIFIAHYLQVRRRAYAKYSRPKKVSKKA